MLILQRKCGESIMINHDIEITLVEISGDKVKIGIEAPLEIGIYRKEIYQIVESNKQAATNAHSKKLMKVVAQMKKSNENGSEA